MKRLNNAINKANNKTHNKALNKSNDKTHSSALKKTGNKTLFKAANKSDTDKNSIGKIVTVVLFLAFIFGFFGYTLVKPDDAYSEEENRTLAQKPKPDIESIFSGQFMTDYEEYIQDQFPLRTQLVALKNYTELAVGKSELNGVFMCKDDYLIENHLRDDYETERAVKNSAAIVSAGNRWAESLGAEHTSVMIVPTAQSILTDKLPLFAEAYNQQEYIDTIKNGLSENVFVDVSQVLKEHSGEYIYYRTDHHWTTYGAYLAYRQWCSEKRLEAYEPQAFDVETAAEDFLGTIHSKININHRADTIEIYSVKDYNIKAVYNMQETKDTLFDRTYLEGKDKYSVFFGGNQGIVEITDNEHMTVTDSELTENYNKDKNEKILLVIKDSYANCFVPMTAGMFDRIYVVDLRYFNMKPDTFMEMYGVTDVLLLYNADTLTDDVYISRIK